MTGKREREMSKVGFRQDRDSEGYQEMIRDVKWGRSHVCRSGMKGEIQVPGIFSLVSGKATGERQ